MAGRKRKPKKNYEPLVYRVEEVAALLGLSRATAYRACMDGELPSIRIGKLLLVPKVALERMLADIKYVPLHPRNDDNVTMFPVRPETK